MNCGLFVWFRTLGTGTNRRGATDAARQSRSQKTLFSCISWFPLFVPVPGTELIENHEIHEKSSQLESSLDDCSAEKRAGLEQKATKATKNGITIA